MKYIVLLGDGMADYPVRSWAAKHRCGPETQYGLLAAKGRSRVVKLSRRPSPGQ